MKHADTRHLALCSRRYILLIGVAARGPDLDLCEEGSSAIKKELATRDQVLRLVPEIPSVMISECIALRV